MGRCKTDYMRVPDAWADLVGEWCEDLTDRGRRPATIASYLAEVRRFTAWADADGVAPCDVDPALIRAWVRRHREAGVGGRSIAQRLTALRSLFDFLTREGVVAANPARAVENPRFAKPLPTVLTRDQLVTLLALPLRRGGGEIQWRDASLLRILCWGGLRASEAARLDWDHLDLTPQAATLTVVDGKGGRDRVVPIPDVLADTLASYLGFRIPVGSMRAVLLSTRGNRLTSRRIGEIVSRYGRRIGTRVHPHMLRAQCGVEMIRAGASLAEVRVVLGHAGYDTLVPYTAVAASEARGVIGRIAGADPGIPLAADRRVPR